MVNYRDYTAITSDGWIVAGPIITTADKLSRGHAIYSYAKKLKPMALTSNLLSEVSLAFENARVNLEGEVDSTSTQSKRTSLLKILHDCYVELCNLSVPDRYVTVNDVPLSKYHNSYQKREREIAEELGL